VPAPPATALAGRAAAPCAEAQLVFEGIGDLRFPEAHAVVERQHHGVTDFGDFGQHPLPLVPMPSFPVLRMVSQAELCEPDTWNASPGRGKRHEY
jgi:hypothetical protein